MRGESTSITGPNNLKPNSRTFSGFFRRSNNCNNNNNKNNTTLLSSKSKESIIFEKPKCLQNEETAFTTFRKNSSSFSGHHNNNNHNNHRSFRNLFRSASVTCDNEKTRQFLKGEPRPSDVAPPSPYLPHR